MFGARRMNSSRRKWQAHRGLLELKTPGKSKYAA